MAAVHVLYGPPIHDAIAKGDLNEMKSLAQKAEEHVRAHGNVHAAVEYLKAEIAKLERKQK